MGRSRVLLILCAALCGHGAEAFTVDVLPAWNGYSRYGATTEITIGLLDVRGGQVEVTASVAAYRAAVTVELEPAVRRTISIPVPHAGDGRVRLDIRPASASPISREIQLHAPPPGRSVAALATVGEVSQLDNTLAPSTTHIVRSDLAALPRRGQTYASVNTMVIDGPTLAALDPRQRTALDSFLAACGRVVALAMDDAVQSDLRWRAGCNGRFVSNENHWLPAADQQTGASRFSALMAALSTAVDTEDFRGITADLLVYFIGYFVVLLLAAQFWRRNLLLPAIPLGAAALGAMVWSNDAATSRLISLSEVHTGDRAARFVALLQLQGQGAGLYEFILPAEMGTAISTTPDEPSTLHYDEDLAATRLAVPTQLLSQHEFGLVGTSMIDRPVSLRVDPEGPEVVNLSRRVLPSGILSWRGERYEVPVLAPQAHWRPSAEPSGWGLSPEERLLRTHSSNDTAALLVPYTLSDAGLLDETANTRGWLLVRPAMPGEVLL